MQPLAEPLDKAALDAFIGCVGARQWRDRLEVLRALAAPATRTGRQAQQRHCIEFAVERLRRTTPDRPLSMAERWIATHAVAAVSLFEGLTNAGRLRFCALLRSALAEGECLVPAFHLLRTAALQRSRGFSVWFRLVDRMDPELQTWLCAHPGRYLLKMTLPRGLRGPEEEGGDLLGRLHDRITAMLKQARRSDGDEAAMLRLDPLMLAAAQADELGLMPRLRQEFGPEAHLAVTAAGGGVFVMAARAGQQNEVAVAVRRRMAAVAPARLTGTRPGILAMFIEDTDRAEWRLLRERLELEGEARQFMTNPEARSVVAVTCASRLELFGLPEPDAAPEGELRFRNPAHPAAKAAALAPAVLSSM